MKPNYQKAQAKYLSFAEMMPYITECISAGGSVEIPVRGKSMRPMLREGKDSVILSPVNGKLHKYDLPLYLRQDGHYVLHRVVRVDGDRYTMAGDNQYVYEKGIAEEQIIAVVSAIRREGKLFSTNNRIYRLYAIFWHHTRALRHLAVRVLRRLKRVFKK